MVKEMLSAEFFFTLTTESVKKMEKLWGEREQWVLHLNSLR